MKDIKVYRSKIGGEWKEYFINILNTESLVNDQGIQYGVLYNIQNIKGIPDYLLVAAARNELAGDTDVWNQTRFRVVH